MDSPQPSRRRFLQIVAAGTAGAVCTGCGSDDPAVPGGPIKAGNVKDLPVNTLEPVSGQPVAIGRDDKGIYALSLICTHRSCDISTQGSVSFAGITCNCHGSKFSGNGAVTQGPANQPLEHFKVDIDAAGELTIQGGTVVDAAARTAVPA